MPTFYVSFKVTPIPNNPHFEAVEGAIASCWVVEDDPGSAYSKAVFRIRQYGWDIGAVEQTPEIVFLEDFAGRDIGTEQFNVAQEHGIATVFAGWARDGESSYGPVRLEQPSLFDLQGYLNEIRELRRKGRCLHFNAGPQCKEFVEAHSIQKNGALSLIAEGGQVYAPSRNVGDYRKNRGQMSFCQHGVSKTSTFRGFCARHDNELFAPIDDQRIIPTKEQVLLFAYRALCREIFIKENAITIFTSQTEDRKPESPLRDYMNGMRCGAEIGLSNLIYHKRIFDQCLNERAFSEVRYVLFRTSQAPIAVFSGVIYPDYDFLANQLQDLTDSRVTIQMLSFSFVPLKNGWGFLFAWHSSSSEVVNAFLGSLATRVSDGAEIGGLLFRFLVSGCENLAFNPVWWKALGSDDTNAIESAASYGADALKLPRPDYLASGLGNVPGWEFESVVSEMESKT